jgi:diguanylate cyclase (GGDEF)-like protein
MTTPEPNKDEGLWPLLERAFEGVLLVERGSWLIRYANQTAVDWFGLTTAELTGRDVATLFADASREEFLSQLQSAGTGNRRGQQFLAGLRASQRGVKVVSVRCCRVTLEREIQIGVLMEGVATTRLDPLTNLPDRNYLYSRLFELLENKSSDRFAVLFVDIDNFKSVNDRHGHLVGDQVLFEAAKRLSVCLGSGHDVVRYGGDEFVVLIDRAPESQDLDELAESIREVISPAITVPHGDVKLSASVGIAVRSPEFRTPNDVLAAADRAMYAAKRCSE